MFPENVCTCPKISFGPFWILYENRICFVFGVVVVKQIGQFVLDLCGDAYKIFLDDPCFLVIEKMVDWELAAARVYCV